MAVFHGTEHNAIGTQSSNTLCITVPDLKMLSMHRKETHESLIRQMVQGTQEFRRIRAL